LDRWLAKARIGLSRNRLQKLIDSGRVLVNGKTGKSSLRLKPGDKLSLSVPARRASPLAAEAGPLAVVHEDAHVLVLDKPAGLVVHPGAGVQSGTLVNALLAHAPGLARVGGEGRPGIVHRLDRDTSGLLVVAKTEDAYQALVEALRERTVTRVYTALVWGDPGPNEGTIELPIGRDPKDRKRMAVVRGPSGKAARTGSRLCCRRGSTPAERTRSGCTWPRFGTRSWGTPFMAGGLKRC
jgi:23S rRNA pseudouridine1911/1915/1917 synthase